MNGAMNRGIRTSWVQMVLSALLALCYTACSAPLTVEGGQRVTSELLAAIQQGELAALDQFYADKFFYTLKVTQEKLGPIKNYALISSNLESSFLGAEKLKLTYRVHYEQVAFRHVFTMVEQNGRARVLSHEVLGDVAE